MITRMSKEGEDGKKLWQQVTRDVQKLGAAEAAPPRQRIKLNNARIIEAPIPDIKVPQGGGIDRKTEDRVRKGEIRIEARLDLHGLGVDQARISLLAFIKNSFASGKRCILVVTGKGGAGKGVIRREFPLWLEDNAIRAMILSSAMAQPKHGGSGAFYIYLRKKK